MSRLGKRVADIEARLAPAAPERWHWIIGSRGETHDDARSRYEREQGPIGPNEDAVIWRVIECA